MFAPYKLNALIVNQNNIVRICLNKYTLLGSTCDNYKKLVNYTKKSFGQTFVDYLGPTLFNSMPFEFKKKCSEGKL
ncbi:Uncharacterized protein FWK35_00010278 [Aphis craccivora]|uniref:Uncharacterized protein n=1 Tax=Aphis craccivora TaxID=307492 RepID=A0A6G0Z0A5_APHCR|nr:Uncharacterized protein FWK35_00010278 [Aphis craccivora]